MRLPTRLIVVSNRLPVTIEQSDSGPFIQPSCGGLVSALRPILRENAGCWVGWTGTDEDPRIADLLRSESAREHHSLIPVFLTAAEKACFYHGYSNEIIWPLFHDLQSRCNFDPRYWDVYRQVTEKFAHVVEGIARRGDFVWVNDYHLMLLAEALRARNLPLRLAYFHHIPFPPPDIFEKLPWRREILRGLLRFNAVGFQTARDRYNFVACLRRCLCDVRVHRAGERLIVRAENLCSAVGSFPISIDYQQFASHAEKPEIKARAAELRHSLPQCRIILGVDRLDYTKGIPQRLLAFRALLERNPDLHRRVTLVQVAVPSRELIPEYHELKLTIERLVSEINGEFGNPGWVPVHYLHRCLAQAELIAYYNAADVALITPLKDGMNLVAKEFCAARADDDGVLVLSEFAGVASELKCGALLVNPYDVEGVAATLVRALEMNERERHIRMQRMRRYLERHDVYRWCQSFCSQLSPLRMRCRPVPGASVGRRRSVSAGAD